MTIAAALGSLNAALTIAKALRQIEKGYDAAVLKGQIVDLMGAVADAKSELLEAEEQLREKDAEIRRLLEAMKTKAELIEVNGFMHAKGEDGKPKGLPFCPNCMAKDGTQIRPAKLLHQHYKCPRCEALYSNLNEYR